MLFELAARARPVLKWAGGKSGLLERIVPHFPTHFNRFVEPFLGGGAVFLSLRREVPAILNDCNGELVNLYVIIRDLPHELMDALDLLQKSYCEEFYYSTRTTLPADPVRQAARTVFLNKTGFNGLYRQNSRGEFNVPFGKRPVCPALYERENLLAVSARLAQATIQNRDFETVLAQAGAGDFVYCDPPYEPLSRTSSFNSYNGGGFSQDAQRRLHDACAAAVRRGATVAVSNSSAEFIRELYAEWDIQTIMARRAINSKGSARGEVEEVLVLMRDRALRSA